MRNIFTFCLDCADIDSIKEGMEYYPLHEFSMNPSIVKRDLAGKNISFFDAVNEIRSAIGDEVRFHVQTVGDTADEIIRDAEAIRSRVKGDLLHVKVDAYEEGYKAMKYLKANGFKVTATAIASITQALVAIECGADTVAVYVGRLDNISGNGIEVVRGIRQVMNAHNINDVELSAASIRTAHQVEQAALAGADQVAVGLDILKACANHPLTNLSVKQFVSDWESLYGKGKRVYNL